MYDYTTSSSAVFLPKRAISSAIRRSEFPQVIRHVIHIEYEVNPVQILVAHPVELAGRGFALVSSVLPFCGCVSWFVKWFSVPQTTYRPCLCSVAQEVKRTMTTYRIRQSPLMEIGLRWFGRSSCTQPLYCTID